MKLHNLNFINYTKNSFSLASNHILDLIPFTLTYIFLQRDRNQLTLPILSLSCSFYILTMGFLPGFEEAIGIRCSVPFATQDYRKFVTRLWRLGLINLMMLCFSIAIVLKAEIFLELLGLPGGLTGYIATFCKWMLCAKLIENFSHLGKGILMAQQAYNQFMVINATTLFVFVVVNFMLVCRMRMSLYGFLIAYYTKIILEFAMVVYGVLRYSHKELFKIPKFTDIISGFISELKSTSCIVLAVYGEWVADEVYTIFAARTGKLENIHVWTLFINLWLYIYFIIMGLTSCMRSFTSLAIGDFVGVKRTMVQCAIYAAVIIGIISVLLAVFSDHIASILAIEFDVYSGLALCLRFYSLIVFWDCGFASLSTVTKLIKKMDVQFVVAAIIYPICSTFYGYLFCFCFNMEVVGLQLALLFTTATCSTLLWFTIRTQLPVFEKRISDTDLDETEDSVEESLVEMEMDTKMAKTRKKFILDS